MSVTVILSAVPVRSTKSLPAETVGVYSAQRLLLVMNLPVVEGTTSPYSIEVAKTAFVIYVDSSPHATDTYSPVTVLLSSAVSVDLSDVTLMPKS